MGNDQDTQPMKRNYITHIMAATVLVGVMDNKNEHVTRIESKTIPLFVWFYVLVCHFVISYSSSPSSSMLGSMCLCLHLSLQLDLLAFSPEFFDCGLAAQIN